MNVSIVSRLALGRAVTGRAGDVQERGVPGQRIDPAAGIVDVVGQEHRKVRDSGTGTIPQRSQWITGMGVPQKRWRLKPQSRRR